MSIKLSAESKNYLKDCFGVETVEAITVNAASCILENIGCEMVPGDLSCDREIWKAYAKLHGIKEGLTHAQFQPIRHRFAKAA